ncbi:hypothetical protein [Polaribacter sp. SA4-12]|uniref:hypothetical protein n=1 Tax=Polaribacter sp. SA4-12 TaxID=1312072 RepID=UPI0012F7F973|nr:hypothetical protein [Polaribacter sp. SA4-12]
MKKVFLVFAILVANIVFTSCTDLDENLENEPVKLETLATGGEEEQDPEVGDDDGENGE